MYESFEDRLKFRKKILVVDDELINREMLANIIGNDYEALTAEDGNQALDVMIRYHDTLSLVLLDLHMPVMDGYELLSVMKNDANLSRIPVIVLTSEVSAEVKSLNMGAADFIPKPFDAPEVILARIRKTIQLHENINILSATQYDELTSLFNREFFMEYAGAIDQYYPDVKMDAVVLDINRFHAINEMNGRAYGDEILRGVGSAIKEYVRANSGIGCRYNADSFYIYIPHSDTPDILDFITERVQGKMDDAETRLRIGIYPDVDRNIEIARRFDRALLACTSIRGNFSENTAYYNEKMHEDEAFAERLMSDMEKGLSDNQFIVYYQPKFAIQDGDPYLNSAEALIRWKHPELGMVSPGRFIPVFEKNGMIRKLDRFVWKEAASQVRKWEDKFGITIPVSVNVSRIDMMDRGFAGQITDIVNNAGIGPDGYMLEVTESAYTDDSDKLIEVVNRLRASGFRIEMDDFGTGYSSLNMLSALPVDVLKLDMRFIRNIHTNPKDLRMVQLVMEIAEYLNMTVVAEGVEYKEQYELLKEAGVQVIQGYYFSKPVPPEEFEVFIKERIEHDNNRSS